ncbi:hypothetical protein CsSME_00036069 [Camellia sinensis var. sinensis]
MADCVNPPEQVIRFCVNPTNGKVHVCDPSHYVPSIPLQLMDQHQKHENEIEEGESGDNEEFRILGHSMFLKRRRDGESVALCSSSSKRVSIERFEPHGLESRRSAVRAWGNQPLCIADPDAFWIMEKEKQRQFKGIELIASENFVYRAVMEALGSHLTNKYSNGMPRDKKKKKKNCVKLLVFTSQPTSHVVSVIHLLN